MDQEQARDSLATAATISTRVRGRASWYARFCAVVAPATVVCTLAIGMATETWMAMTATAAFQLVVAAMVVYGILQPVTVRGFGWLHGTTMVAWGVLYAVALFVGMYLFPRDLAWWGPAAAATAVPFVVAAVWTLRSARRTP